MPARVGVSSCLRGLVRRRGVGSGSGPLLFAALLLAAAALPPASAAASASATAHAPVRAIHFEGNDTTREHVLRREMALEVGDPADPQLIEASRQAIFDLGLFREVAIDTLPVGQSQQAGPSTQADRGEVDDADAAGVLLRVRLREKYYLLPVPRLDTSSDRDVSYGLQLRWNNVGGRNHSLNLYVEEGDFPEDRLRESERSARASYVAPFLFGSPFELDAGIERIERRRPPEDGSFDETLDRAQLLLRRDFTMGKPRQGWILGAGLLHQRQQADGPLAPPDDGRALAAVLEAEYRDLRFHLYSETGQRLRSRLEWADPGSDYDYQQLTASYGHFLPVGETPHQTLHLLAEGGLRRGGPDSRSAFFLGGSGSLRGYASDSFEGEDYWLLSAEYLRPLRWPWLRFLAVAEVGGAGASLREEAPSGPHASIGLGLRIRLTWLVNTEIELGYAWPLRGGDGGRFFAGGSG